MWLRIASGAGEGTVVALQAERFTIGAAEGVDLRIADPAVDPVHASMRTLADGSVVLYDESGPDRGTYVQGERLAEPRALRGDEQIRIGETLVVLSLGDPTAAETHARPDPPEAEVAAALGVALEEPLGGGAPLPARTRREYARRAVASLRSLRSAVRWAVGLAAVSLVTAAILVTLALTGAIGGDEGSDRVAVEDVVATARPGTVLVKSTGPGIEVTGSGWVLDAEEGLVVTNHHIVNGGTRFEVEVGGDGADAEIRGAAPCDDLALLELEDSEGLTALQLGSQGDLEQGETVVAVGFPANASGDDEITSTAGVVSVVRNRFRLPLPDSPRFENLVQTDASLNPGNSGGPLLDAEGAVVGVNTAILTEAGGAPVQGQGYAIGVDRVKEVVEDLRRGRSLGWVGASLAFPGEAFLRQQRLPEGIVTGPAAPDTGAADVGLENVLLVAIDGRRLEHSMPSYCDAVEEFDSGDATTFEAITRRGGRPVRVRVEFE